MRVVVVNSAKGGVGKSFVTEGLALALAEEGHSVGILDLDITTPNISKIDGVKMFNSALTAIPTKAVITRLVKKTMKEDLDYLIVDTPPTVNSVILTLSNLIKEGLQVLYVTTPSENAVMDTGRGIRYLSSRGATPLGVVQNMVGKDFGEEFDSQKEYGLETMGVIELGDKNTKSKFVAISAKVMESTSETEVDIEQTKSRVRGSITSEEIEDDTSNQIPLQFYNLESWPAVRQKLMHRDRIITGFGMMDAHSLFDASTEKIKKVIDAGESVTIMVSRSPHTEFRPVPFEIADCVIDWTSGVAKGLPMLIHPNGTHLWLSECIILDDDDEVASLLKEGGHIEFNTGRYLPRIFTMLSLMSMYDRHLKEADLVVAINLLEKTQGKPHIEKELIFILVLLFDFDRANLAEDYDSFDEVEYLSGKRKSTPEGEIGIHALCEKLSIPKEKYLA